MSTDWPADARERDARVAEIVFGYRRWSCEDYGYKIALLLPPDTNLKASWRIVGSDVPISFDGGCNVPHYTTEIQCAWLVVEEMQRRGYCICIACNGPRWRAAFHESFDGMSDEGESEAETAPLSICLAALAALEEG